MDLIYINKELTEISKDYREGFLCYQYVNTQKARSLEQNALYWKWIEIIANESGYTKNELHSYFKYSFIAIPLFRLAGRDLIPYDIGTFLMKLNEVELLQTFMSSVSTTSLKTNEFTIYLNEVAKFALEFGINFED
jgi:hypothetical protein